MAEEELKLTFQDWNGKLFSGVIPDMPVTFRDSIYGLGAFECCLRETKMPFSITMIDGTGAIEINSSLKDGDWQGVLLHEMVHAYFAVVGLGREKHGARFHNKCDKIEQELGRSIPRTLRKA